MRAILSPGEPSLNQFSVFQLGICVSNANMDGTSFGGSEKAPLPDLQVQ